MADDILKVGAIIDLSQIVPGLNTMAQATAVATGQMNTSFLSAGVGTTTSMKEADASLLQFVDSAALVPAEIVPNLNTVKPPLDEIPPRTRRVMSESTEARHALRGMGEMMGVHMPRYISSFVANLDGIGPVLARAFSVVAILGLVQVLIQAIEKLGNVKDALLGWDEARKKAFSDAIDANLQMIHLNAEHGVSLVRLGETGKAGLGKITAEQTTLQAQIQATGRELAFLQTAIVRMQTERRFTTHPFEYLTRSDEEIKKVTADIERLESHKKELETGLRFKLPEKGAELGAKTVEEVRAEQMALEEARFSAEKSVGLARVAYRTEIAHEMLRAGTITQADETVALLRLEEQKLAIERRYIEQSIALAKQREAATGKSEADKITALNAQLETLAVTHNARMAAIRATQVEFEKRQAIDIATTQVGAIKSAADAQASIEEEWIRRERETRRVSVEQETALLTASATTRYEANRRALQDKIALAELDHEKNVALILTLNNELELLEMEHQAKLATIKAAGQAARLDLEQRALEEEASATAAAANRELETAQHTAEMRRRSHGVSIAEWESTEQAALSRWYDEQVSVQSRIIDFMASRYKQDSVEYQQAINRKAQLDQEYASKAQAVQDRIRSTQERTMQQVDAIFGRSIASMLTGQEKLASGFQRIYTSILDHAVSAFLKMGERWLFEQEFMGRISDLFSAGQHAKEIARAAQRTATESAENAKTVAQRTALNATQAALYTADATAFTAGETAKTAAKTTAEAARVASMTASAATETTIMIGRNTVAISSDAGAAAAAQFRNVMEVVPFPANLAAAPAAAAEALAQVEAFNVLSAAGGMDVTRSELVKVHERETILPAGLSAGFKDIIAAGTFSTPAVMARGFSPGAAPAPASVVTHSPTIRFSYAPVVSALDARGVDEVLQSHNDTIAKIVQREMRRGALPSW